MSKYSSLNKYLQNIKIETGEEILLTFQEIEKIIGEVLPKSAGKYKAWWAKGHEHSKAWLDAGMKADVDFDNKKVHFKKIGYIKNLFLKDFDKYISINPSIRFGKPCIKGTRITVQDILQWLASGMDFNEIIDNYPELQNEERIRAALAFAANREKITIILAA